MAGLEHGKEGKGGAALYYTTMTKTLYVPHGPQGPSIRDP